MSRLMFLSLAIVALTADSSARAQTYVETFEQGPTVTMLNGAVTYGVNGPWSARVSGGRLLLSNSTTDNAVRYYTLQRLQFSSGPQSAEDATIEAAVTVEGDGDGRIGIGLIARYDPKRSTYIMFATGAHGEYYVVVRRAKARVMMAAAHGAIRTAEANHLRVRSAGSNLIFEVNGQEVTRFPADDLPGRFVGIAAFGRGSFSFDDVRVTLPGTPVETPR